MVSERFSKNCLLNATLVEALGAQGPQETGSESINREARKYCFFLAPFLAWLESLRMFLFMPFR